MRLCGECLAEIRPAVGMENIQSQHSQIALSEPGVAAFTPDTAAFPLNNLSVCPHSSETKQDFTILPLKR